MASNLRSATSVSLQQAQTNALLSLLNLNEPPDQTTTNAAGKNLPVFKTPPITGPPVWKILVLDQQTKDILATILRVQDLRDAGVTLHVQLHSLRPALPDVPAIYFVSPTLANVQRIAQDLQKGLYESYHFNFVEPLPRSLLEELASLVAQDGTSELVEQVVDQYLSFISPSPSLFSLLPPPPAASDATSPTSSTIPETPSSYLILNSPSSTEQQIEEEIERIASGLFSAVATLGHVPFIRAPRGNAAEMVAKKLETKIRDTILSASRTHSSTTNLFSQDSTGLSTLQRPLLLILDRNVDLVSVLAHGWTYQALVSDCLEFKLNRVTVAPPKEVKKSYDLDSKDFFWGANAAHPFPQVAEEIDTELNRYKANAAEITRTTGVSDVSDVTQLDLTANAALLKTAITQLPELTLRKAIIDTHMNIAATLLEQIKKRGLDELFSTEEAISKQTTASILEFLRAPRTEGTLDPVDKLRLVLVFYLSAADNAITREDILELEKELKSAGAEVAAFEYVRRTREISRMMSSVSAGSVGTSTPSLGSVAGQGGELFKGFSALGNKLTDRLKDGRFDTLISGVKNFLPTNKLFPVTRLVEALMDSSAASNQSLAETDEYIFLDPRAPRHANAGMPNAQGGSGVTKGKRMAFGDGIVFVVGGAGYVEYGNLQEWATRAGKCVTYGGTDIMDPSGFVKILQNLGSS